MLLTSVLVPLDALAALYLAGIALDLWSLVRESASPDRFLVPMLAREVPNVFRAPPWSVEAALILSCVVGSLALAPFLVRYVARHASGALRPSTLLRAAVAGIIYGVAIVWTTAFLFLPIGALGHENVNVLEIAASAVTVGALGGVLFTLFFSPILLVGGSVVGVLDLLALRAFGQG